MSGGTSVLVFDLCLATIGRMSTIIEIESAVVALPRDQQTELLRFVSAHLGKTASPAAGRTGAELAQLWPALSHLTEDEAAAFDRDLVVERAASGGQAAPAWE